MATYDLSHIPELRDLQDLANRQKARDEALKARMKALENKGGQANVIETIKVNGQAQAVNAKAVDITVPTKTSQLTNDSSWQTSAQVASAIQTAIAKTGHASFQKVDTVPGVDSATENVMYLVLNPKTKEEYDLPWGGKLQFYSAIVGGAIDARFMPAILKGIMEKMDEGPLTGSYARDIRVVIYDGKMHPVDSNEISFKLAARNAFKEAFRNAGPKIMEPIYSVEVLVPSEYMGAVMSDLQNRRAMIAGMESDKGFDRLNATVPLAELYRYSTTLSSLTSGSATYSMKFSSYEQVPADVQDKLLKAYTDTDEE